MTLLVLITVLSQSPLPAGANELPPNHPPTPGAQPPARPLSPGEEAAPLPPGHPRIDGTSKPAPLPPGADTGPLPPNHPPINGAAAPQPASRTPSIEELIKKLDATPGAATADWPFEMSLTIGRLYLTQGRMKDAAGYYEQAVKKAQPARDFYEAQRKLVGKAALPAPESVDCAPGGGTLDALFAKAKAQADAKKPLAAVACARAALTPLAEAERTLGHAKFMAGDSAGAQQVYERTLATFESTEAHYAHAALLVDAKGDDVKALQAAKAELEKVLKDAPTSNVAPQAKRLVGRADAALKAGGMTRLIAATPPPAPPKLPAPQAMAPPFAQAPPAQRQDAPPNISKETMEAFQNAPRTAELEAGLQKLVDDAEDKLAKGQFQDALNDYRGVMPYQPDNPRVRAGMAWTLIRLNKQPMAERVWGVATGTPDAISELGDRLKAKGDAEGAKALWQKLVESVPSYAPKLQGKL